MNEPKEPEKSKTYMTRSFKFSAFARVMGASLTEYIHIVDNENRQSQEHYYALSDSLSESTVTTPQLARMWAEVAGSGGHIVEAINEIGDKLTDEEWARLAAWLITRYESQMREQSTDIATAPAYTRRHVPGRGAIIYRDGVQADEIAKLLAV